MKKLLVAFALFAASAVYANDEEAVVNDATANVQETVENIAPNTLEIVKKAIPTNPEEAIASEQETTEQATTEEVAAKAE